MSYSKGSEEDYSDDEGVEPQVINVDVSTYTAPFLAEFIPQDLGSKAFDMIGKEIVCIAVWVLQMFIMRQMISGAVPWSTRATANWQVQIVQVVAVFIISVNLSTKVEAACDLIPAVFNYKRRDGSPHWGLLLSLLNGILLLYFLLSCVYNAACAIAVAHLVTQALGYLFTFGVVLSLDTLFASQAMINKFWFNHALEDDNGNPLKDKDGNDIHCQASGSWNYTLGYALDEENDHDADHARIVGTAPGEDPSPLFNPKLWACNFEGGNCVDMVMRQVIRLMPIAIIIGVFSSTAPSTFGYCRASTSEVLSTAKLLAENRHVVTSPSDCASAARLLQLSDQSVSGTKGVCSFDATHKRLHMTMSVLETERVICQNRDVKIPIRVGEFIKAKYFPWFATLTFGRGPSPLCSANNMFDLDDTVDVLNTVTLGNSTACDEALKTLGLEKYEVNTGGEDAAFPNDHFAQCLGQGGLAPVGVCRSAYDEDVGNTAVPAVAAV